MLQLLAACLPAKRQGRIVSAYGDEINANAKTTEDGKEEREREEGYKIAQELPRLPGEYHRESRGVET